MGLVDEIKIFLFRCVYLTLFLDTWKLRKFLGSVKNEATVNAKVDM